MMRIKCYKGIEAPLELEMDEYALLSQVREKLQAAGFMPADTEKEKYRFLLQYTEDIPDDFAKTEEKLAHVTIQKSMERTSMLKGSPILGVDNRLTIFNICSPVGRPPLIGYKTDWLYNGFVGVHCRLNKEDSVKQQNNGLFQPIMLKDVFTTKKGIAWPFHNVCICCEGSAVEFILSSWGAVGFTFSITPEAGKPIADRLFLRFDRNYLNVYGQVCVRRWQGSGQTIVIEKASSVSGIIPGRELSYQKVTFKTARMTKYNYGEKGEYTCESNANPPATTLRSSDIQDKLKDAPLNHVIYVDGNRTETGVPTEGPAKSSQTYGTICNPQTDDWDHLLGEVVVYFFVFKNKKDAEAVVEQYESLTTDLWK